MFKMAVNVTPSAHCQVSVNDAATGDKNHVMVDSEVYEVQLTQLQEQLITAMIENESIKKELDQFKLKYKVDELLKELEYERDRNLQLCNQLHNQARSNRDVSGTPVSGDSENERQKKCLTVKLRDYLVELYLDLLTDFTTEPDTLAEADAESEQLAVKRLKDNIKRSRAALIPIIEFYRNVGLLLSWHSPVISLLTFTVYMYSVWYGWLLPLILFLCMLQLSVNFLRSRGWQINAGVFYAPCDTRNKDSEYPELALSDKFNLVLQVARQVQNTLGQLADGLEKMKNLLMWQHPEASRQLFMALCLALLLSCSVAGVTLLRLFALYLGIKMFIIQFLYTRFPRLKERHDSVYRLWKELPNDVMLQENYRRSLVSQFNISVEESSSRQNVHNIGRSAVELSESDKTFCAAFSLPLSERPLTGWEGGWRVTIVDKEKPFIKAFSRSGRLYLTNSFLCFERFKTQSQRNIIIPLTNITRIEKAKPFTWLPGTGMSIQLSVVGFDQPYIFGAIVNRDECFNQLVLHGSRLRLGWALEHSSVSHPECEGTSRQTVLDSPPPTPASTSTDHSFRMSSLRDVVDDDVMLFAN